MKVPDAIKSKWDSLFIKGDLEKIRLEMPEDKRVTNALVSICVRKGEYANLFLFETAVKYFNKKEKEMKRIEKMSQ